MQELRANTQVIVPIGSFPDVGDGFTPQTDIDISGTNEAELLKHGSTTVVDISGATWAAIANCRGWYGLTLTTSHTNTEGMLTVIVQDDSDCLPVHCRFMVLSEAAWDSKYAPKDDGFMDVNIKTIGRSDTQETEANNLESACSNYSATRGLTGTAVPAATSNAAGGLPISAGGGLALDTILGRITGNVALASVLGALNNAAADGDVTATDTLVQYVKQLINILIGTPGIVNFPGEQAPGNATSLAEVIRAIHADVTGLNGSAMIGTNSAATAAALATHDGKLDTVDALIDTLIARITAARAGYLDNLNGHTAQTGDSFARIGANGASLTILATAANLATVAGYIDTEIGTIITHLTDIKGAGWTDENLTTIDGLIDTLVSRLTAARAAVLSDWIDTGRLDTLLDAIPTAAQIKTAIEAAGSYLALVKAVTDALTVAAATKLALSAGTMLPGTVSHDNTVATTTVIYCDDITEATAEHFIGRHMYFTSGALNRQETDITDYELVSGEGKFTVTALTEAPADNDTFIIA